MILIEPDAHGSAYPAAGSFFEIIGSILTWYR